MRLGICVGMVAEDPEKIGFSRIAEAAELGFDYAELPLAQVMQLTQNAFKKMLRAVDMPCLCMNNFFPASVRLTGPEANEATALNYVARALDRAAELGAVTVVFGSGGARNIPDGFSHDLAIEQLIRMLSLFAPLAKERGITLVIEPLNRMESNIINSLGEGIMLARSVNHPSVACLVDFFHAGLAGDPCAFIREAGSLLRHVHIARTFGRSMPVYADEDAYQPFFSALHTAGYDMTISLEASAAGGFSKQAKHALTLLRSLWNGAN